jgi:ribosome biogenesis SPOUT family RNA methylase Rps3
VELFRLSPDIAFTATQKNDISLHTNLIHVKVIIEHLEPELSKWILYEYESAYNILGDNVLITGVKIDYIPSTEKRFHEVLDPTKVVILDPFAEEKLSRKDLTENEAIIIGGILGDHPPRGRTKEFLSDNFPQAKKRNLGKDQFTIDSTALLIKELLLGKKKVKYTFMPKILCRYKETESEIDLPFAYVLLDGKPYIYPKLFSFLTKGLKECIVNFDNVKEFEIVENSV